ncbi:MAG: hypothetical protein R3A47_02750 [Polyangiales bacterium]
MLQRFLRDYRPRLPRFRPYLPRPSDPAIFWFNSERDDIIDEVVRRVCEERAHNRRSTELSLNDAAFQEVRRLAAQRDNESKESIGKWKSLLRSLGSMSDEEQQQTTERITFEMAKDVAGNFDPRVYTFAAQAAPKIITGLLRPSSMPAELSPTSTSLLGRLLKVEGPTDRLRKLQDIGTMVYVPTHSSNLDSIVVAQALNSSGLAPVIYGAEKTCSPIRSSASSCTISALTVSTDASVQNCP